MTENNTVKNRVEFSEKKVVISVVTLVVLICLAVGIFFYSRWHGEKVVLVLERWGNFGDFFGGILNPVIGLGGVILLAYTLIQNQKALTETAQIMKSQAELIQHDQRRQSVISITTAFGNILMRQTTESIKFQGLEIKSALLSDICNVYFDHIIHENKAGREEFCALFEKWCSVTTVTSLFALKQIVDEETDPSKKQLLLAIVTSFIPVTGLLVLYSSVRALEKESSETIKLYAFTLDFIRDCANLLEVQHLVPCFDDEAERLFKLKKNSKTL